MSTSYDYQPGSSPGATAAGGTGEPGTTDIAKDQASGVAASAKEQAGHVAEHGKEQVAQVAGEAKAQARNLVGEARGQVDQQVGQQRDRLVGTLRSFGDELEQMVNGGGGTGGLASDLAQQAAQRTRDFASMIDGRETSDLLNEVSRFARRRPGAFLAGALVAGLLAGRVTRGAKAATSSDQQRDVTTDTTYGRYATTPEPVYDAYAGTGDMPATPGLASPDIDLSDTARGTTTGAYGDDPLTTGTSGYRDDAGRGYAP